MKLSTDTHSSESNQYQLINARERLWLLEDALVHMPSDFPMECVCEQVKQVRKAEFEVLMLEIAIKREAA